MGGRGHAGCKPLHAAPLQQTLEQKRNLSVAVNNQGFIPSISKAMSSSSDDDAAAHVSGTPAWQNAVQSLARSTALAGKHTAFAAAAITNHLSPFR